MTLQPYLFMAGVALLWIGADVFIRGGNILARILGVPALIIGLTLGAIGTSLPEILVSWLAAGMGSPGISLGNAVGSNMANIGLALALGAVILPVPVEKEVIKYDYWVLLSCSIMLYVFSLDLVISSAECAVFAVMCAAYIAFLLARGYLCRLETAGPGGSGIKGALYFIFGIAGLLGGAKLTVDAATAVARQIGVSEAVIGLTAVAVGTSLPEIAVVVAGSFRKSPDISMGTIVGSNIFNILLVAGGAGIISPIILTKREFFIQSPVLVIYTLLLFPIILSGRKITRAEGILLLLSYCVYIYVIF
ncbi:MAG: calcium/sodium antiporter [Elusimicrobia bacterium]|nr:calcium/sodium antiporter [Elusimicrobiota bacterium]